jgi:hypothetical protein
MLSVIIIITIIIFFATIENNMTNVTNNTNTSTINQATNQPTNQSTNQATNQPTIESNMTNVTREAFTIEPNRRSEFVSKLTSTLYKNGQSTMDSLVIATAMLGSIDKLGLVSIEKWIKNVNKFIHRTGEQATSITSSTVMDTTVHRGFVIPNWFDTVVHAELLTRDGEIGDKLMKMIEKPAKAYPALASEGVTRKHPMIPSNTEYKLGSKPSSLAQAGLGVQEVTPYTSNEFMVSLSEGVGKEINLDDRYVIDGCRLLISQGNHPSVSEHKADHRIRTYQSDCHGPQFAASDMSRSFMDLHGVSTDYDIIKVVKVIRDEMLDMITGKTMEDLDYAIDKLRNSGGLVMFVVEQLTLKSHENADTLPEECEKDYIVSKVWSFVKANRYLMAIEAGKKPYIGMAFGLDAKCSGPQLGAIMTGDITLARACGFGSKKAERDAYEIAIDICVKRNVHGLTRKVIKTAYMGIFYGQGYMTFCDLNSYGTKPDQHNPRLLKVLKGIKVEGVSEAAKLEEQAKIFHGAIEASFGNMSALRKAIKEAHYHYEQAEDGQSVKVFDTTKPTMYRMPDNSFIAMDYKQKVDIHGETIRPDAPVPDVTVDVAGVGTLKFERLSFNTPFTSLDNHARTGFVNLIQGTDALIARHILTSLNMQGAKHAVSVHDCFRVNINDFIDGKLHQAIKDAYKAVFINMDGSGDILKNYFQGVKDAGGVFPKSSIAYMLADGELKMNDWIEVEDIIDSLENKIDGVEGEGAYYFSK